MKVLFDNPANRSALQCVFFVLFGFHRKHAGMEGQTGNPGDDCFESGFGGGGYNVICLFVYTEYKEYAHADSSSPSVITEGPEKAPQHLLMRSGSSCRHARVHRRGPANLHWLKTSKRLNSHQRALEPQPETLSPQGVGRHQLCCYPPRPRRLVPSKHEAPASKLASWAPFLL